MESYIQLQNVSKSYEKNQIFSELNINFEKNKIYSIIGPSGSGKTTLMRCLAQIENFDSGEVFVNNEKIKNISGKIGFVFQNFNLFSNLNVLQNLTISSIMSKRLSQNEAIKKAKMILKKVGLEEKVDMYPSKLSGGQKQRVAIARTLMNDPEIIIFDEPTSALDPESTSEVLDIIKEIIDNNTTAIIITHEMKFAKEVSHEVIFMENGLVIERSEPQKLFNSPNKQRTKEFIKELGK